MMLEVLAFPLDTNDVVKSLKRWNERARSSRINIPELLKVGYVTRQTEGGPRRTHFIMKAHTLTTFQDNKAEVTNVKQAQNAVTTKTGDAMDVDSCFQWLWSAQRLRGYLLVLRKDVDRTPHTILFPMHNSPCAHAPHGSWCHNRLCTKSSLPSTCHPCLMSVLPSSRDSVCPHCRRRMIEERDTINELRAIIQELQNEVNCVNGLREFQDVEFIHSGQLSHVPSQPALFPNYRGKLEGMLSRDQSPRADIWNPQCTFGNVFYWSICGCFNTYAGMLNSWVSDIQGNIPVRTRTEKPVAEGGEQSRDTILTPRFLRRPSAKDSLNHMEGRSLKNYGADQQRPQISEFHFDKFPTPATF